MTWLSGASGNCICAMAPTSKPRRRILMLAARSLWPITLGMAMRWGPRLSATRTCQPRRTWLPAGGSWDRIFPSGDRGAVVLPFYIQFQSALFSDHTGRSRALSHQIGHGDFVAVDGQAHGSERGDQRHDQQDQRQQDQAEEGFHLSEIIVAAVG